jgi:molybdopterin molybdotransferase
MPQRITSLAPLDDVLTRITACVNPAAPERAIDLTRVLGRTVAEDIVVNAPIPPMPLALRDGWALSSHLTIDAGTYAPASIPAALRVEVGEVLPPNTDAVAVLDVLTSRDGEVQVLAPVTAGEGVLPTGGDAYPRVTLIHAGERLDPIRIALLAALGITQTQIRAPRVGLISAQSRPDRVLDPMIASIGDAIGRAGGIATITGANEILQNALAQTDADALIVIGGTGCGRRDNAVETLAAVGNVQVHGVGLIPAETTAFGTIGPRPVLLLPGRFDAALAAWHVLGRAMLTRLTGNTELPCLRPAKLTRKVSSNAGLAELVAVQCHGRIATPLASGYVPLSALCRANGWILVPAESEGQPEHSDVIVRPWP